MCRHPSIWCLSIWYTCYLYIISLIKDGLMFRSRLRHDHNSMHSSGIVLNIINKRIVFLFTVNSQTLESKMEWLVFKSSKLICQWKPKTSKQKVASLSGHLYFVLGHEKRKNKHSIRPSERWTQHVWDRFSVRHHKSHLRRKTNETKRLSI